MMWGAGLSFCMQTSFLFITIGYTGATATNRTIDDEFGDSVTGSKPVFLPTTEGIWEGQECRGCRVQPDRAIAFKGTWNAATFRPEEPGGSGSGPISIELSFKGTAIYVYFITGNEISGGIITTLTECNFTLDGQRAGFFQHISDKTTNMQYNVLGFSRTNLANVDHTLRVSTGGVGYHVLVVFDYATYTFDDGVEPTNPLPPLVTSGPVPSTPSIISSTTSGNSSTTSESVLSISGNSSMISKSSPTIPGGLMTSTIPSPIGSPVHNANRRIPLGTILAGIIGGVVLVLAFILLCFYHTRKKRQRKVHLTSSVASHPHNPSTLPGETSQDLRHFVFHKRNPFMPNSTSRISGQYGIQARRRISGISDVAQHVFVKGALDAGSSVAGRSTGSPSASSSSAVIDDALRTRQMELEHQLLLAEQGLRELGLRPRLGPLGSNAAPAVTHTAVHIEYRHAQGDLEEPPPQYSEG